MSCGGEIHLQTTPAQGGTEIERGLLLLAFERLSQLTLTLLCYQLVRLNKIKQSFKCVSSVDIIFKIIPEVFIFLLWNPVFDCGLYFDYFVMRFVNSFSLLGMSFFLAFIYML